MNAKVNLPDEVDLGKKEYSWRADWKVNGWLFVAALISCACDMVFPSRFHHWPLAAQVAIVLAQFLALALWARRLGRWIRGMDEMHRRTTTSAILFSAGATFFFLMLWHRLDRTGLFNAMFGEPKPGGSWDICTVGHGFLLLTFFYFWGQSIFNRRYR